MSNLQMEKQNQKTCGKENDSEQVEHDHVSPDVEDYTPEEIDQYVNANVIVPHVGELLKATVKC